MNLIKSLLLSVSILSAGTVVAQTNLPERHSDIADNKSEMSKCIKSTFMDLSLEEARKHSPFANIAESVPAPSAAPQMAGSMVNYAKKFLGTRYILGANGPKAFDCSGFTSYVYKNFGITLNRTSRQQFLQGDRVSVGELQPGDLLFFSCRSSGRGNVGHVAMVVSVDKDSNSCQFIHASVKKGVSYQKFPDHGYFSRKFIGARRILGSSIDLSQNR